MEIYRVGFVFSRCFVQKEIKLPSATVKPLSPTGFAGEIHEGKKKLESVRFSFTRKDLENTLRNYASTGHCTLVEFEAVEGERSNQTTRLAGAKSEGVFRAAEARQGGAGASWRP